MSSKLSQLTQMPGDQVLDPSSLIYVVNPIYDGSSITGYNQYKLTYEQLLSNLNIPSDEYIKDLAINVYKNIISNIKVNQYIISYAKDLFKVSADNNSKLILSGRVGSWTNQNSGLCLDIDGVRKLTYGIDSISGGVDSNALDFTNNGTNNKSTGIDKSIEASAGTEIYIHPSFASNAYFYNLNSFGIGQLLVIQGLTDLSNVYTHEDSVYFTNSTPNLRDGKGTYTVRSNCNLYITARKLLNTTYPLIISKNGVEVKRFINFNSNVSMSFSMECSENDVITWDFTYAYKSDNDKYQTIVFAEIPPNQSVS